MQQCVYALRTYLVPPRVASPKHLFTPESPEPPGGDRDVQRLKLMARVIVRQARLEQALAAGDVERRRC